MNRLSISSEYGRANSIAISFTESSVVACTKLGSIDSVDDLRPQTESEEKHGNQYRRIRSHHRLVANEIYSGKIFLDCLILASSTQGAIYIANNCRL